MTLVAAKHINCQTYKDVEQHIIHVDTASGTILAATGVLDGDENVGGNGGYLIVSPQYASFVAGTRGSFKDLLASTDRATYVTEIAKALLTKTHRKKILSIGQNPGKKLRIVFGDMFKKLPCVMTPLSRPIQFHADGSSMYDKAEGCAGATSFGSQGEQQTPAFVNQDPVSKLGRKKDVHISVHELLCRRAQIGVQAFPINILVDTDQFAKFSDDQKRRAWTDAGGEVIPKNDPRVQVKSLPGGVVYPEILSSPPNIQLTAAFSAYKQAYEEHASGTAAQDSSEEEEDEEEEEEEEDDDTGSTRARKKSKHHHKKSKYVFVPSTKGPTIVNNTTSKWDMDVTQLAQDIVNKVTAAVRDHDWGPRRKSFDEMLKKQGRVLGALQNGGEDEMVGLCSQIIDVMGNRNGGAGLALKLLDSLIDKLSTPDAADLSNDKKNIRDTCKTQLEALLNAKNGWEDMAKDLSNVLKKQEGATGRPSIEKLRFLYRRVSDYRENLGFAKNNGKTLLNEAVEKVYKEHKYEFYLLTDSKWGVAAVNAAKKKKGRARTAYWNCVWAETEAEEGKEEEE